MGTNEKLLLAEINRLKAQRDALDRRVWRLEAQGSNAQRRLGFLESPVKAVWAGAANVSKITAFTYTTLAAAAMYLNRQNSLMLTTSIQYYGATSNLSALSFFLAIDGARIGPMYTHGVGIADNRETLTVGFVHSGVSPGAHTISVVGALTNSYDGVISLNWGEVFLFAQPL